MKRIIVLSIVTLSLALQGSESSQEIKRDKEGRVITPSGQRLPTAQPATTKSDDEKTFEELWEEYAHRPVVKIKPTPMP